MSEVPERKPLSLSLSRSLSLALSLFRLPFLSKFSFSLYSLPLSQTTSLEQLIPLRCHTYQIISSLFHTDCPGTQSADAGKTSACQGTLEPCLRVMSRSSFAAALGMLSFPSTPSLFTLRLRRMPQSRDLLHWKSCWS